MNNLENVEDNNVGDNNVGDNNTDIFNTKILKINMFNKPSRKIIKKVLTSISYI